MTRWLANQWEDEPHPEPPSLPLHAFINIGRQYGKMFGMAASQVVATFEKMSTVLGEPLKQYDPPANDTHVKSDKLPPGTKRPPPYWQQGGTTFDRRGRRRF